MHEYDQVLKGQQPEFKYLGELKYLTMVIEESMRLYPPAWTIGKKTIKSDIIGKYKMPAGHNLLISPYALHRDERF